MTKEHFCPSIVIHVIKPVHGSWKTHSTRKDTDTIKVKHKYCKHERNDVYAHPQSLTKEILSSDVALDEKSVEYTLKLLGSGTKSTVPKFFKLNDGNLHPAIGYGTSVIYSW